MHEPSINKVNTQLAATEGAVRIGELNTALWNGEKYMYIISEAFKYRSMWGDNIKVDFNL